jgi:hypothetical protein
MKSLLIKFGIVILIGIIPILTCEHSLAEIFKWVDEKGTVHFTEDPSMIPEKYRDKVKSRETEEDLMTPEEKIRAKQRQEAEIRERLKQEKREQEIKKLEEQLKKIQKDALTEKEKELDTSSRPSPGFIPFEKFKYLQEGMTEAEVLSRFGEPTRVVKDEAKVSGGTISGEVSRSGDLSGTISERSIEVIKRYYYIGDKNKGEKTTIIHFQGGRVVKYERI